MSTMEWSRLLSTVRPGQKEQRPKEGRTDFNTDHDRIIFSSAFRRLQDKTQVFPLAETDYVRTRLTHSLEASNIGRTLGTLTGRRLLAERRELAECTGNTSSPISEDDFGAVVATAALAHDIGNPPFGHSGEDAIRQWFACSATGRKVIDALPEDLRADFLHFEGNAQGYRILSRLQYPDRAYGMRLTCATQGTFMKYPCEAGCMNSAHRTYKKYGLFAAERDMFAQAAAELGLIRHEDGASPCVSWARHPLAYLVEAADDISYSIADIEDGFRRGRVTYDEVFDLLSPFIRTEGDWWRRHLDAMRHPTERVEFLRAMAIGGLVHSAVDCFMEHEAKLLAGVHLEKGLTRHMALNAPFATLGKMNFSKVYQDPQVVEIEAAGFEVMDTLLNAFGGAVFRTLDGKATARDRTLLKLYPESRHAAADNLYEQMLEVTDFVSGMTDTSAVTLYKKLSGVTLAKG
ncbi:deoxyguanosinetriphosphate triphosphohydrolase [Desulfovibrio mangrovi]|uniref:deoxyguanosinetriphosphate triphosphohydrolase n=1 Tax=Desulfovibrio mangrovi TaxID=2976983 RepID=UPI0022462502|nr:deoxyguanosinetriphosphate triphosphohydrolase [Desulfovibrio mangrovi]UZP66930.1 deoxyguanosinetriphosphate triphosphohydrolase [Desulfovibrio mangrovi]